VLDDLRVRKILPGHNEFQHDVIGEQDVRRVLGQFLAVVLGFLAGVPGVGDGRLPLAVAMRQKLFELLELAVGHIPHPQIARCLQP
jgi:hypothetical protein